MTTTPKPLSAADIHNTYSMGIRDAASNKPVTGEYKRTSRSEERRVGKECSS